MKHICISEQSFDVIIEEKGVYVDKTKHIYDIFKNRGAYFISRPRRFGKSLLCSTLSALFSAKKKLFEGTWIHKSDWEWKEHPVIHLDMATISDANATIASFTENLMHKLERVAREHGVTDIKEARPGPFLGALIQELAKKTESPAVVIIDEYDKPMIDVIGKGAQRFEEIRDVLRTLYVQLKSNAPHLRLVFLTGVYKFVQTSIFSGLNNLIDLTLLPEASQLLGYSEDEIRKYFEKHLEALSLVEQKTVEETVDFLREQYNGYTFGVNLSTTKLSPSVYNPYALGYVFAKQQMLKRWFESGSSVSLLELLRDQCFDGIKPEHLTVRLSALSGPCSLATVTPLSILFYTGYLTIRDYDRERDRITLDFPNAEVATSLSDLLLPAITGKNETTLSKLNDSLYDHFHNHEFTRLKETLNTILAQLPYHLFANKESYYQTILFFALNSARLKTIAEDMTNAGRADLTVKTSTTIYIIELKMNQAPSIAIQQIKEKNYAAKYRSDGRTIILMGIELSSRGKAVKDFAIEAD